LEAGSFSLKGMYYGVINKSNFFVARYWRDLFLFGTKLGDEAMGARLHQVAFTPAVLWILDGFDRYCSRGTSSCFFVNRGRFSF
jgi:hypothetical protein